MSEAKRSTFKSRPVLQLSQGPEDERPFTFGMKKAKLILEHINDIQAFVSENEQGGN